MTLARRIGLPVAQVELLRTPRPVGDAFTFDEIKAFALADFAVRCGVDRKLMRREAQRLASAANRAAFELAHANDYRDDEREFVASLAAFIGRQAQRLADLAHEAAEIPAGLP